MVKSKRKRSYLVLGIGFYLLWCLCKLGGMPNVGQAMASAAIDVSISVAAMVLTVEALVPAFVYRSRFARFCAWLAAVVLLAGSAIILSQLALIGSSVFAYQNNISRYHEHFFYWFCADLVFGSYMLVSFLCLTGMAVKIQIQ